MLRTNVACRCLLRGKIDERATEFILPRYARAALVVGNGMES